VENKKYKFMVKATKAEDALYLAENLRKEDLEEMTILGHPPFISLMDGFLFSDECWTAFVDNHIIGMFGFNKETQSIWFLGSELSRKTKREWLIVAKEYINRFLNQSPILTNTVSTNNKLHIRWLKRMGAKFSAPYLINDHYFQDFYLFKGD
jgi:hypothetical protein